METKEKVSVVIKDKKEIFWTKVRDDTQKAIEDLEMQLMLHKEMSKLANDKIKTFK